MTIAFYGRYAFRALLREGQRTVLALLCIAFGVMSLVGMQLLSNMIRDAVVTDPRASLGGDALVVSNDSFAPQDLARLESLRADGTLSTYTLMASSSARWLKPPGTGKVYLLAGGQILGVDPAAFPQVGQIHLSAPDNTPFRDAIRSTMDAVITRDVADKLNLKVGDSVTLIGDPAGAPATLRLAGIADVVPGARGDSVFYSLDTARALAGQPNVVNAASVLWGPKGGANSKLNSADWRVFTVDQQAKENANVADLFGFMLKGAGIMGLFVGGIGVANTLQVLLARRILEIATLKTLGYRRRDLLALFGIETALLGLAGSVVGVIAALLLALLLKNLMGNLGALLLAWEVDPLVLLSGALAGVLTAVIFGLYTIVRASSVRPAVLLRDLPAKLSWGARLAALGLLLVLLAVMTAISILIMGKTIDGLAVVGAAIAGLIALTLILGGTLLVALSAPTPGLPMIKLARRNLKRRPMRSVFALIALFCGVFAIGLAASVILNVRDRLVARQTPADKFNVTVYGKLSDTQAITGQLAKQGVETIHTSVRVPIQAMSWGSGIGDQGSGSKDRSLPLGYLDGRSPSDATWDITLSSGLVAITGDGALLPKQHSKGEGQPSSPLPPYPKIGDTIAVQAGGTSATVRVVGFYEQQGSGFGDFGSSAGGLIVSQDLAKRLGGASSTVVFVGHVPLDRLAGVTTALGESMPQTSVVSQADLNDARNHIFEGLFAFAVGLAGLALVAGAILIANAVGLAMVERRREMGILKAVGFTSSRVLGTLLIENALLGLIAGVLGMAGVGLATVWIDAQRPQAELSLDPTLAVVMTGVSVALALLSASLVAWQPTHVRPLEVLRNE